MSVRIVTKKAELVVVKKRAVKEQSLCLKILSLLVYPGDFPQVLMIPTNCWVVLCGRGSRRLISNQLCP